MSAVKIPVVKAVFSKPMSTGDSTLMMLLSLNLLLLVFFMMLNSMATYGAKHAKDVLAQVKEGYDLAAQGVFKAGNKPLVEENLAMEGWRAGVLARVQGLTANRILLNVLPQQGNAARVEVMLPEEALFGPDGRLVRPEVVRNLEAAAGTESRVTWQVMAPWPEAEAAARRVAALAAEVGKAEFTSAAERGVKVTVVPGGATKPEAGLQVKQAGEAAGGSVQGVEEKAVPRD